MSCNGRLSLLVIPQRRMGIYLDFVACGRRAVCGCYGNCESNSGGSKEEKN